MKKTISTILFFITFVASSFFFPRAAFALEIFSIDVENYYEDVNYAFNDVSPIKVKYITETDDNNYNRVEVDSQDVVVDGNTVTVTLTGHVEYNWTHYLGYDGSFEIEHLDAGDYTFKLNLIWEGGSATKTFDLKVNSLEEISMPELYNTLLLPDNEVDSESKALFATKAKSVLSENSADIYASVVLFETSQDYETYKNFMDSLKSEVSIDTHSFEDFDIVGKEDFCYLIKDHLVAPDFEIREYYVCTEDSKFVVMSEVHGVAEPPFPSNHVVVKLLKKGKIFLSYDKIDINDGNYKGSYVVVYDINNIVPNRILYYNYSRGLIYFVSVLLVSSLVAIFIIIKRKNHNNKTASITLLGVISILLSIVLIRFLWVTFFYRIIVS